MVTVAEAVPAIESRGGSSSASSRFPRELRLACPVTWLGRLPGARTPPRRYGFRAWGPGSRDQHTDAPLPAPTPGAAGRDSKWVFGGIGGILGPPLDGAKLAVSTVTCW
ncbi:unnamed protein product [Pipistrellus nathusii]|uniref:Uncharacterized protein n=1 Tax=Pipistrellus nathusii TaxID=59473 RepID=A0ABP0A6S4_PIPNA